MDVFFRIVAWLSDHEAAISAAVGIMVLGGAVVALAAFGAASGSDDAVRLTPHVKLSLEEAIDVVVVLPWVPAMFKPCEPSWKPTLTTAPP